MKAPLLGQIVLYVQSPNYFNMSILLGFGVYLRNTPTIYIPTTVDY